MMIPSGIIKIAFRLWDAATTSSAGTENNAESEKRAEKPPVGLDYDRQRAEHAERVGIIIFKIHSCASRYGGLQYGGKADFLDRIERNQGNLPT